MCDDASMSAPRPPRVFRANEVHTGRVNLDGYPFRYVVLAPTSPLPAVAVSDHATDRFTRGTENTMFDEVLSAVEFLETRGWELVSMDQGFVACMRRVHPRP
jgi:hypothetical protein